MHFERQSKNNANVCALLFKFPRVNVVLSKPSVRQEDFEHKAQKEAENENQEHRQSDVPSSFRDEPGSWKIFIPMFYHRKYK